MSIASHLTPSKSIPVHYSIIILSSAFAGDVMAGVENYEISSKEGKDLLKEIEDELSRIKLGPEDDFGNREYESNKALYDKVKQLLEHLGIGVWNVRLMDTAATDTCQTLGHTVWRISKPILIGNKTGPSYTIPISVKGTPCLNPGGPLKSGWYMYHTVNLELKPELDCVFAFTKASK